MTMRNDLLAFVHHWASNLRKQIESFRGTDACVSEYKGEVVPWLDVAEFHLQRALESRASASAMAFLVSAYEHWGVARRTERALHIGRKITPSKAGANSGQLKKDKAAENHAKWIATAKQLRATGCEPHNLTAKVASRFGKSTTIVRPVLQAARLVETQVQKRAREAKKKNKESKRV